MDLWHWSIAYQYLHTEVETKWTSFGRRHFFECIFVNEISPFFRVNINCLAYVTYIYIYIVSMIDVKYRYIVVLYGKGLQTVNAFDKHTKPFHVKLRIHRMWTWCCGFNNGVWKTSQIARFMVPTWGPSGADRTQVGPMLAPWTLLSGTAKRKPLAWLLGCIIYNISKVGNLLQDDVTKHVCFDFNRRWDFVDIMQR